jgi:hypothetical protein
MKKQNPEKYLIIVSEILLIVLFALLYHQAYYIYAIICFIGALLIWLFETKHVHLISFWTLLITGAFVILILENFLLGIVIILFAFGELFLNDALKGNH